MKTKSTTVYQNLREMIITGNLRPGAVIDQDGYARQFNCSRLPVRQALLQLASEGLVTVGRGRRIFVSQLSLDDMVEIYSARAALEPMLAKAGARKCEKGQVATLLRLLDQQRMAVEQRDPARFLRLDRDFHDVLHQASGFGYICKIVDQLRDRASRYIYAYVSFRDHLFSSLKEHEDIVEAVSNRQYERVEELVRHHIEEGAEKLAMIIALSTDGNRQGEDFCA
jgi:DNA-binding GntR family transcriptional regulator